MNSPKCAADHINFVIASPRAVSATGAAKVHGDEEQAPAHDAFTRLRPRLEPDAATLWREAQSQVRLRQGIRVIDDSTLDKPSAKKMASIVRHWSGKHHAVVSGLNLLTWLWADGDRHVPCEYRLFDKEQDSLTTNDHGQVLVKGGSRAVLAPCLCSLCEGYGLIRVCGTDAADGDVKLWATHKGEMNEVERVTWASGARTRENDPRGIAQFCVGESVQVRARRPHLSELARVCGDWKDIVLTQGSVGMKRQLLLSGKRDALLSPIRSTRSSQLRNF
jgi:hypothetical protein